MSERYELCLLNFYHKLNQTSSDKQTTFLVHYYQRKISLVINLLQKEHLFSISDLVLYLYMCIQALLAIKLTTELTEWTELQK